MRGSYGRRMPWVERDGVRIAYDVTGHGEPTIVCTTPPVVPGRAWKAQVPYLARRRRVVTIDPRGNGGSSRPTDPAAYADDAFAGDVLAVLDAVGADRAVLVGICTSAFWALLAAARDPERVAGVVAVAPSLPLLAAPLSQNVELRRRDYRRYLEEFFSAQLPERYSSKQWADCVAWGLQTSAAVHEATAARPRALRSRAECEELLRGLAAPVLVIHGSEDREEPPEAAARLAELTGGELVTLDGVGHLPMAREPVVVNLAIEAFVERVAPRPITRRWTRPLSRGPKVLYLSSPIGLGHARRDLAIARELRALRPDARVDWLTQHPVTALLEAAGERVHPASAALLSESGHIEAEAGEHELNAFRAIREMDELMVANFMVFHDAVSAERYDLWVADEGWEVDHFLHENPELKTAAYAWLTDFVGWLPLAADEVELTAERNAEMLEQVTALPRIRDRAIFIGDREDVVDAGFGPGLPEIAEWTAAHFSFAGYVTGSPPTDRDALRAELGYRPGERVCVVTVGGSGVGAHLLRRVVAAQPEVARRVPGLRMVVVTGPRIDPRSLAVPAGVEVHGFLPELHHHLAACDVAVVQGGLTTTMELVAARRPFLYFPLARHFEQQVHVPHRLARYGAGRRMDYATATPEVIAAAVAEELAADVTYLKVDPTGAARVAASLAEML